MTRTVRIGFGILTALLLTAVGVVAAALLLDVAAAEALIALAVLDAIIVATGYRIAKWAARADKGNRR